MAAFLITCVIIQAVLLWVIECRPLKNGPMYKARSTGGGSYKAPGDPESTHGASQDGSWVMSPITFSGGQGGSSTSNGSPSALPPPPESFPGELLQVEATNEKGAYESETQEKGTPPLPASAPQLGASMPSAFSRGSSFPFNMRFLRGQYLTGTYTDYTSSLENGRDDSQENHYIVYDSPSSSEEEQQQQQEQQWEEEEQWEGQQQEWDSVQPVWQQQQGQSVQMASLGMPSGYGQQAQSFPTRYYQ
ncbi:alpha-protein kinase 1 [Gadus morhua]|uniref:alpha-protein kinase 1 n=1 Tax=Gadus morhua TaxID=8049 RepID=UPI0011B4991C|nr:alpha-protein kinase 1-like [Gadus morhua]